MGHARRRRRRASAGPAEIGFALAVIVVLLFAVNQLWGHWVDPGSWVPKTTSAAASSPDAPAPPPPPPVPPGSRPCQLQNRVYSGTGSGQVQEACLRAKAYAHDRVVSEWGAAEWPCLDALWDRESNWDAWVLNKEGSGAYGIAQIFPSVHGHPPGTELGNWKGQVDWGLAYIRNRPDYRSPCRAYELWQSRSPHWY